MHCAVAEALEATCFLRCAELMNVVVIFYHIILHYVL